MVKLSIIHLLPKNILFMLGFDDDICLKITLGMLYLVGRIKDKFFLILWHVFLFYMGTNKILEKWNKRSAYNKEWIKL